MGTAETAGTAGDKGSDALKGQSPGLPFEPIRSGITGPGSFDLISASRKALFTFFFSIKMKAATSSQGGCLAQKKENL
jgi:hypothetical protein